MNRILLTEQRKGTAGTFALTPLTNIIQLPTLPLKVAHSSRSPCVKTVPNKVIPDVNVFHERVALVVPVECDP